MTSAINLHKDIRTPAIPGYTFKSLIGEGAHAFVYLAEKDGRQYAVKILKMEDGDVKKSIYRLRRECANLARFHHPNIIKTFEAGASEDFVYMTMEYLEKKTLMDRIAEGPLSLKEVVKVGCQLAQAFTHMRANNTIHRDIKPANILVSENLEVRIIDFDLSVGKEQTKRENKFAGSLLYASPEQCQVVSRDVDYRSDLYSLGCLLYECGTGTVPFKTQDASELLRLIASHVPDAPSNKNPHLSGEFDRIILKLLQKDPDERYLDANELLKDLLSLWEFLTDEVPPINPELTIAADEIKVVGRDDQLQQLRGQLQQTLNKEGNTCLVTGFPGIGKSFIIQKIKTEFSKQALFLNSKAEINNNAPFSAPRELLKNLAYEIEKRQDPEFRRKIAECLEAVSNIIHGVCFKFDSLFLDDPSKVVNDTAPEVKANAVASFFHILSKKIKGLVLIVDDIQWLDAASIEVFTSLTNLAERSRMGILATSRSDSDSKPALTAMLERLGEDLGSYIDISYLDKAATRDLIYAHLDSEHVSEYIVDYIFKNTNGLPFAIKEYLDTLVQNGLLIYNWGKWQLDESGCKKLEVPKDVIDLLLWKTRELPANTLLLMKYAAVKGKEFYLDDVAIACGIDTLEGSNLIQTCLQMQLVSLVNPGSYKFNHDRVQEAFLKLCSDEETKEINKDLALKLLTYSHDSVGRLYSIADHLMLSNVSFDPLLCLDSTYKAGEAALTAASPQQAYDYLTFAETVRQDYNLPENVELLYTLARASQALIHTEEADHIVQKILKSTDDKHLQGRAYIVGIYNALNRLEMEKLWKYFKNGIHVTGGKYYGSPVILMISAIIYWIVGTFFQFIPKVGMSESRRKHLTVRASLLDVGILIAHYRIDPVDQVSVALMSKYTAFRLKDPAAMVTYNNNIGALACYMKMNFISQRKIQFNLDLAKKLNSRILDAKTHLFKYYLMEFVGRPREAEIEYKYTLQEKYKWMTPIDRTSAETLQGQSLFYRGKYAQMLIDHKGWLDIHGSGKNPHLFLGLFEAVPMIFSGDPVDGIKHVNAAEKDPNVTSLVPYIRCLFYSLACMGYVELDEKEKVVKAVDILHNEFDLPMAKAYIPLNYNFISAGYGCIYLLDKVEERDRQKYIKILKRKIYKLRLLSFHAIFGSHYHLFKAYLAYYQGKPIDKLVLKARIYAEKHDIPIVTIYALKLKARVYRHYNDIGQSKQYASMAQFVANQMQFTTQANEIRRVFRLSGQKSSITSSLGSSSVDVSRSSGKLPIETLRMQTQLNALLKISHASSQSMDIKMQYRFALQEVLSLLKAERAIIFIFNDIGSLIPIVALNSDLEDINVTNSYSNSIVTRVIKQNESILRTGTEENKIDTSMSIINLNLKSIIASPMKKDEHVIGAIYLDNSLAKGIFTSNDLDLLEAISAQLSTSMEAAKSARLEIERKEFEKDLEVTGLVQSMLLPKRFNLETHGYCLKAHYQSASQSGGDWFDFMELPDSSVVVVMADATGHGAGAAMVTSIFTGLYRGLKAFTSFERSEEEAGYFLQNISQQIHEICGDRYWLTVGILWFDPKSQQYCYFSAGAPPVLIGDDKGEFSPRFARGMTRPIGGDICEWAMKTGDFKPGYRALLFTDGFSEMKNHKNKQIGFHGMKKILAPQKDHSISQALAQFIKEIDEIRDGRPLDDDQTAVLIEAKKR